MQFFQFISTLFLVFAAAVYAGEAQFTVTECATIEAQREAVQAKMRGGYNVSEYNRLTGRDLKLFNLLARHCQQPERDDYLLEEPKSRKSAIQTTNDLTESFPMMRSDNAVFVGEKAKAWDNFYQMPDQCRLHQQSRQDFVYCAEDKVRQREAFLQSWQAAQQQNVQNPETVAEQAVVAAVQPVSSKVVAALMPQQQVAFQPAVASNPERQMVPLQAQAKPALSEQLSFVWVGALLVFLWMSWWLWRR